MALLMYYWISHSQFMEVQRDQVPQAVPCLAGLFTASCEEGVVVTHQQQRNFEALGT